MPAKLRSWWYEIRGSLWFLPSILTAAAIVLATVSVWIDQRWLLDRHAQIGWLFGGGVDGARGVLQAIASTMITVTALVFSITVVALQLASSQLSPRVLRTFMADRGNQTVLGFFIGTFTYALLVLRVVHSPLEDADAFVPSLSVTLAIVLALISVGLLIFFVHHAANAMRASVVIDRAAWATRERIDQLYPEQDESDRPVAPEPAAPRVISTVCTKSGGYLQAIDIGTLLAFADRHAMTIRVEPTVGDFLFPGEPLASIWPTDSEETDAEGAIRDAFVLGLERTLHADVAFGFQQLSDIAVRSLSPGINDPTTAIICIDRLGDLLVHLSHRGQPPTVRKEDEGEGRLIVREPSFADLLDIAFDQIRHYGAGDPTVMAHLLRTLARMSRLIPADYLAALHSHSRLALSAAEQMLTIREERARVELAGAWAALPLSDCAHQDTSRS